MLTKEIKTSKKYVNIIIIVKGILFKGAVSRNSAKLGNYKMPVKLRET